MRPAKMSIAEPSPRRTDARDTLSCRAYFFSDPIRNIRNLVKKKAERRRWDSPRLSFRLEHQPDQIRSLRSLLPKPLQSIQIFQILEDVHLPLEPIPKRMSAIRKRVVEQAPQRKDIHRFR